MSCKNRFIIFLLAFVFSVSMIHSQDLIIPSVNAQILNLRSEIGYITFYDAEENKIDGRVGMDIPLQSTIVTEEGQRIECVIKHNDKPIVGLIISEVTDFYYDYDSQHDVFYFELHYGRVRVVSDNRVRISTESEYGRVTSLGCDFGIISFVKDDGSVYESVYDFEGRLSCESKVMSDTDTAARWDRFDTCLGEKSVFTEQELLWWQDCMLFDLNKLPKEIPYVLETLMYPQRQDVLVSNYENLTSEEKQELAKLVLGGIFRFEGGYFFDGQTQGHGVNIGWTPGGVFMNRKLEFRLDLGIGFCLTSSINNGIEYLVHRVNNDNNPWSFGFDQGEDAGKIAFDLFDDLFMKLGLLRYGFDRPTEPVFLQMGNYFDVSDKWHYSFFGFNPQGLSLAFRHNSFVTKVNTRCFETFIYAEDIMPRGIYGLTMKFMTPAQSVKWKLGFSVFTDTYDLIKFGENTESLFPTQTSLNLEFSLIDVPSFGFDLYLNGGINIPFSYNFADGSSLFNTLSAGQNVAALFTNISADLGTVFRIKHFYMIPEFIVDTKLNRVGQFDMSYSAKRHLQKEKIEKWYADKTDNAVSISDFFFGARFKLRVDDFQYVKFELAYQASVAYSESWAVDSCFYDKVHFTLKTDIGDKYKVGFNFSLTYQVEELVSSVIAMTGGDYYTFLENSVAFASIAVAPLHVIEIAISGGMRPDYESEMRFTYFATASLTIKPNVTVNVKK